jgi:hypothetical protein
MVWVLVVVVKVDVIVFIGLFRIYDVKYCWPSADVAGLELEYTKQVSKPLYHEKVGYLLACRNETALQFTSKKQLLRHESIPTLLYCV